MPFTLISTFSPSIDVSWRLATAVTTRSTANDWDKLPEVIT